MKKKLLLIIPKSFSIDYMDVRYIRYLTNKRGGMMNAGLGVVAALTPPEFEVKIVDENVESITYSKDYDMVGITGFPSHLEQAKKISQRFRELGVFVVCGGPSASISPERWRAYADVLIIGEAERIWPQFLADYLAGSHKKEYIETERFDLTDAPVADYSGISPEIINQYICGIVQTSRGCPYDCEFCDVIVYVGRKMRYKPPETVIKEIEQFHKMGFRATLLADDNFSAGRKNAKMTLRALRDWNRKQKEPMAFLTQVSIDIAKDEEFLELAADAGLKSVLIGIETPNAESLKETGKIQNLKSNIIDDVKIFHQHGILVTSGCVLGFDHDDLSIFQKQFDFFSEAGVPNVHAYPLQAPDKTRLKARMEKEGRFVDWTDAYEKSTDKNKHLNIFNSFSVIPKQMTTDQLRQGTLWLLWKLYNPENYAKRFKIFIDNFETSTKKDKLQIPKPKLNKKILRIAFRLIKYYLFKATAEEKAGLRQMLSYAKTSSLPHRYNLVLSTFLTMKNTREMIKMEEPQIHTLEYPT